MPLRGGTFVAAKPARPSAPVPSSAREDGSGTDGAGRYDDVAVNVEGPVARVLKE